MMVAVSLIVSALVVVTFLLPWVFVVGAWIWARRLGRRAEVPRFVKWVAYALVVPGAFFIAQGVVSGLLAGFGRASGESIDPSQKARRLAEGISEFMNSSAFGFVFAVVALVWLGFWAWKVGRKAPPAG
jgi:hypothetical protein